MDVVFTEAFAFSTYTTSIAMVDLLAAIVIPKLADIAVIPCRMLTAIDAVFRSSLGCSTRHAKHVLCHPPIEIVVLNSIVTMPAGVPVPTLETLYFDVALVVLASK